MNIKFSTVAGAAVAVCVVFSGCAGSKPAATVKTAVSERMAVAPVVTKVRPVSAADKKKAEVFWKKAVEFSKNKQYKQAITQLDCAIKLSPRDEEFWYARGASYLELKDCGKAISDLNKALDIRPNFGQAVYLRALAYCLNGDSRNAVVDYTELIALGEKSSGVYLGRGRSYHQLGQVEKARADYMTAIKLNPKNDEARSLLKLLDAGQKPGPVKW